jgi:hypothetical protein
MDTHHGATGLYVSCTLRHIGKVFPTSMKGARQRSEAATPMTLCSMEFDLIGVLGNHHGR